MTRGFEEMREVPAAAAAADREGGPGPCVDFLLLYDSPEHRVRLSRCLLELLLLPVQMPQLRAAADFLYASAAVPFAAAGCCSEDTAWSAASYPYFVRRGRRLREAKGA